MQLILNSNSASNPQTLDLSSFIRVSDGEGLQPADPSFTQRVFSRSLLKAGATLSLTQYQERELQFPLRLKSTSSSGCVQLAEQIYAIIETPGATAIWQDDGLSATTFDLIIGNFEVQYRYREAQQHFLSGLLRLFAQPFGRTAGPRPYAAASGVGPLLMISPYGATNPGIGPYGTGIPRATIGASTQAGVSGFGQTGPGGVPSSGVFYWGSPSLAGDAPAQLQISYSGPLANNASDGAYVPYTAISVLPDATYQPIVTVPQLFGTGFNGQFAANAVASEYQRFTPTQNPTLYWQLPGSVYPQSWAGQHRLFAIARASGHAATLTVGPNVIIPSPRTATVYPADWQLCDLGVMQLKASQSNQAKIAFQVGAGWAGSPTENLDLTAFVMLPDNATWFFNPTTLNPSQYGNWIDQGISLVKTAYTNTLLVDDVVGDQFIYAVPSQMTAPSPAGMNASSIPMTAFTRGLVARPDPKNGLPIVAILGLGQAYVASANSGIASAAWPNPVNTLTSAQVSVVERFRYVAP